jgi:hypothetical protein
MAALAQLEARAGLTLKEGRRKLDAMPVSRRQVCRGDARVLAEAQPVRRLPARQVG